MRLVAITVPRFSVLLQSIGVSLAKRTEVTSEESAKFADFVLVHTHQMFGKIKFVMRLIATKMACKRWIFAALEPRVSCQMAFVLIGATTLFAIKESRWSTSSSGSS